jgi:small subunit ribosomal protein S4e
MVKNHLKAIAAPKTWPIQKKANVFVSKPNPGAHSLKDGVSLITFFTCLANICKTAKEVSNIIYHKKVSVNGKQIDDKSYCVGLYDTVKIEATKDNFRIVLSGKGKLVAIKCDENSSKIKPCKIIKKTLLKNGKAQINLSDGRNILSKDNYSIGDTLIVSLPKLSVSKVIPLEKGSFIQIVKGRYIGLSGEVVDIIRYESANTDLIVFKTEDGREISTLKSYAFVLGQKMPEIKLVSN